jgi:hypothetical protein
MSTGYVKFDPNHCSVLQRRSQAEAINGPLAMIGLTAGLIVEAQTGKGILGQVLKLNVGEIRFIYKLLS